MNYIKEINAFYVKIELNPLTASAHALWHALLHMNNRSGWKKEFSVAAGVICYKAGLPLSTFKRARNELAEKGYITYTSRGSLAPVYRLVSLAGEEAAELPEQADTRQEPEPAEPVKSIDEWMEQALKPEAEVHCPPKSVSEETVQFYQENVGNVSAYVQADLERWAAKLSDAHVVEALKRAVESGHGNWGYAKGILNNWHHNKLHSMHDVLQAERKFRSERTRQHPKTTEIIPDWFYESKRQRHRTG